jgi:hypothetical protein
MLLTPAGGERFFSIPYRQSCHPSTPRTMPTSIELRPLLLVLHFLSFAGALGTSAVMHSALVRLRASRRAPQALDAMGTLKTLGPRMPLWALALFLTGASLAQTSGMWHAPFVSAGIIGIALMLAISAVVLKPRLTAAAQQVAAAGDAPLRGELETATRDPVVWTAALVNPAIAYSVMFDMTVKPGALGCAAAIAVAVVGAVVVGMLGRPVAAPSRLEAGSESGS